MGSRIASVAARWILDSRGLPTIEAEVRLTTGTVARGSVASGAAPTAREAREVRDRGTAWAGMGVSHALACLMDEVAPCAVGRDAGDQEGLDCALVELDGTDSLTRLGANAILPVSLAAARAYALDRGRPLWKQLSVNRIGRLPVPMMNLIQGGPTAPSPLDFQEFMIVPVGAATFADAVRIGAEIYQSLGGLLRARGLSTAVGEEGGFCPQLTSGVHALDVLVDAISAAGYTPGADVSLAVDAGANTLWDGSSYTLAGEGRRLSSADLVAYWRALADAYPLVAIEDGMDDDDVGGWQQLTVALREGPSVIGDDVFVTDVARLRAGASAGVANATVVKLNQVGTLTGVLNYLGAAEQLGYDCVLSHRSGETDDHAVADIAVARGSRWIKAGAPARGERTGRYNHLLRIEHDVACGAAFAGRGLVRPEQR